MPDDTELSDEQMERLAEHHAEFAKSKGFAERLLKKLSPSNDGTISADEEDAAVKRYERTSSRELADLYQKNPEEFNKLCGAVQAAGERKLAKAVYGWGR